MKLFFLSNTFYFTGFADDNTKIVISYLEKVGDDLMICFSNNPIKAEHFKMCNLHRKISLYENFVGITFDYKLNFAKQVEDFC